MYNKVDITDSATIKSIEYDCTGSKLIVEFKSGSKYRYRDVDSESVRKFVEAESKGKYFSSHIKDKFVTEKIGATLATTALPGSNDGEPWPFPTGPKPGTPSIDYDDIAWTEQEEEEFLRTWTEDKFKYD